MGKGFSDYLKKEDVKVNEMSKELLYKAARKAEVQGREPNPTGADYSMKSPEIRKKRRGQAVKFVKGMAKKEFGEKKEGSFADFKSFFEGVNKNQNYGVVKIKGKPERIPQHSSGEIVFLGNKKVASKHLKQLKKDGNNGYLTFGMHQKLGDKVKGK